MHPEHAHSLSSILLIETDAELRTVLRAAFEDEGYEVYLASEAPSADEVVDIQPDLVMLDIERNKSAAGWQLVQELKATPRMAHMPIVITSGDGAIVAQQDVRVRSEAAAILVKPFSLDDLLPVVSTALARRDFHHAVQELIAEPSPSEPLGCIGF
jgi:DNA-binding response OmpR family regulator